MGMRHQQDRSGMDMGDGKEPKGQRGVGNITTEEQMVAKVEVSIPEAVKIQVTKLQKELKKIEGQLKQNKDKQNNNTPGDSKQMEISKELEATREIINRQREENTKLNQ